MPLYRATPNMWLISFFQAYYPNTNDFDRFINEKERGVLASLVAMDQGPEFELSKEEIIALIEDIEKNA